LNQLPKYRFLTWGGQKFRSTMSLSLVILTIFFSAEGAKAQKSPSPRISPSISADAVYSESDYLLGAGDRIRVEVFQLPQYSGEQEVLVNGSLNLPRIGSVSVRGLTLETAAKVIAAKYTSERILRNPQVTVTLLTPRPVKIGIAGEINRPGSYTIPIQGSQVPTITQVLQLAGGITQAADLRAVQIERLQNLGTKQTINVDLWQLVQTGDLGNDLTLRDGDTIFIPTAGQINLAEAPQLSSASFSSDRAQPIKIAVLGEVRQPGTHTISSEQDANTPPTVTEALEIAGGINPLADIQKIQIRRLTKSGAIQTVDLDLKQLLLSGDLQQDLILQNGDTVFVPTVTDVNLAAVSQLRTTSFAPEQTQPLNITIIGEVFRPGPYTVTGTARTGEAGVPGGTGGDSSVPPTVTRAIQVAGGIKPLANVRQIEIRRRIGDGSERTLAVDLWKLLREGDSSQDTVLQDGDTIFVPQATAQTLEDSAEIAAASFSPDTIEVQVVGEVNRPGIVQIPPNTPLNQAIFSAGGFTNRAEDDSVELIRLNPNGTVSRREIELDFGKGVNDETNPVLYNNDVVIVSRSTLTGVSDTLDTVLNPLGKFLTIFSLPFNVFRLFE
jgi:polysaccharide export outer membrane protein